MQSARPKIILFIGKSLCNKWNNMATFLFHHKPNRQMPKQYYYIISSPNQQYQQVQLKNSQPGHNSQYNATNLACQILLQTETMADSPDAW